MSIELNLLDKLKYRVQLARKIETTQHKIKKANHDRNWMKETAEALEIELDSDFVRCDHFFFSSSLVLMLILFKVMTTKRSHPTKNAKQKMPRTPL